MQSAIEICRSPCKGQGEQTGSAPRSRRPTPCCRSCQRLLLLQLSLRAQLSNLSMTRAGTKVIATAGTAWSVPITEVAAGTPSTVNAADAESNAVQIVDPNDINEIDR